MKTFRWWLLALMFVSVCHGEDAAVAAAPEWEPMEQAQIDALTSQARQMKGRLIDGSLYSGGGGATFIGTSYTPHSKASTEQFITGFIGGLTKTGPKLVKREPVTVKTLNGACMEFQGNVKGQDLTILAYVLFSKRETYIISIFGAAGMKNTDPVVTSYLARIKFDPSVAPVDLNHSLAFEMGRTFGRWLAIGTAAAVVLSLFIGYFASRQKRGTPPPLPFGE